jgi:hypothetical protein
MITPDDAQHEQKRGAPRRRVLMSAQIVHLQGKIVIDCVIRNISETGAQLATESAYELPASFWLRLSDGTKRPVELVWSKANLMGVRFLDVRQPEPNAAELRGGAGGKAALVARIVEIERQLAELRAEITIGLRD